MGRFFLNVFILSVVLFSSASFARLSIVKPKDGDWLPFTDDEVYFEVSGKVEGVSAGSELVLSFDGKESSKVKTGKDSESISQYIYCCSRDNFGFYEKLVPNRPYEVKIAQKNSDIDGVVVKVPAGIVVGKDSKILVYQAPAQGIPLNKYLPLSAAVGVVISKVKTRVGVQYSMKIDPSKPREDTTNVITAESWSHLYDREWKDIDLKKAKIVVLASDYGCSEWSEIAADSISDGTVTFKQSDKDKNLTVFVIAARLKQ